MGKTILGKKVGMSQIFTEDGTVIPVSVVSAGPCFVIQIKTLEKDGYEALKVAFEDVKAKSLNKPNLGQFADAKVSPKRYVREFKVDDINSYKIGDEIKCSVFKEGDFVDVVGISKGKGFTGPIKRWNFHKGPMSHGSGYHRGGGALGGSATPGRVFKNKKMAGQHGNKRVTVQNLQVVKVDDKRDVLLIAGGIPGPNRGLVTIKSSCKKASRKMK